MIYVDTSVALAWLLAEDRHPTPEFWSQTLVSSRLLEYEVWTRINALGLAATHGDAVRTISGRIAFVELIGDVLGRAQLAFPAPLRTLDALHLATADFLREQGQQVRFASYDVRLRAGAAALGLDSVNLA